MADISKMKLPDNTVYNLKDSRVAVPVPADAVFTDHIFSGLAGDVDYDNTESGLTSTTVQDALDEIADGGGSTGCVELTQAEYDALPREEKLADVIYLITDSPDNYLDEVFGDFATVEHTNTASKAYAVGDYLVYDSKFYKVTSAIAQGDTIVPDTNVAKTTVADECTNKVSFKIISSGSLHDIRETGIFYLTSVVTDKPTSHGGFYVVTAYNPDLIVGNYISLEHYVASVVYTNGVWSSVSNSIRNTTLTDTTTATGAFAIPTWLITKRILELYPTTYSGLVFRRDAGYFTCLDNNTSSPIANTTVTLSVTYLD